jgi:uncharacterized protein
MSRGTPVAAEAERTRGLQPRSGRRRDGLWQEDRVAKEDRGFASMDRLKQREIASKGGKAAHQKGTAHEWTSEEAREAGRKGGMASHRRRKELTPDQAGEMSPEQGSPDATERSGGDDQNEQIR